MSMIVQTEGQAEIVQAQQALAPTKPNPLEPTNFEQAMRVAELVCQSKMFGVKSPADAFVRMATGTALGIGAITALNLIDAIPGPDGPRPAMRAKLKVALCLRSPECEYFECVETTNKKAVYRTKRRGREERIYTYTIEDADLAGYTKKDNWKQNPAAMLRARCSGFLSDMEYPDVVNNIASSEERWDHEVKAEEATAWTTTTQSEHVPVLTAKIDAAANKAQLDAAWALVTDAKKKKDIDEEQFATLKSHAGKHKAKLAAQTPDAPAARPTPTETVTPDGEIVQ